MHVDAILSTKPEEVATKINTRNALEYCALLGLTN